MHSTQGLSASQAVNLGSRKAFRMAAILPLLLLAATAWAAPAATTTTLTLGKTSSDNRQIVTLTAKVNYGAPAVTLMRGLVRFYDNSHLLGTAQIVNTGAKFAKGTANLAVELAPGQHPLWATFAGTVNLASSSSKAQSVLVQGQASSVVLSATGDPGDYTLTVQVPGTGAKAPTGKVTMIDYSMAGANFGTGTLAATAKAGYSAPASYPVYESSLYDHPMDIAAADFNGDGILDLAVLDNSTGLSIYLGMSNGLFENAAPYCTLESTGKPCGIGSEPTSLAVADVNADGIPDLIVASGNFISVALGKGDGTFEKEVRYATANGASQVRVADLNLDGVPDLVAGVQGGLSILMGVGDGTFEAHREVATSKGSTYISIGDFNHDGIPDVVAMGWNGSQASILLGKGDGGFSPEVDSKIKVNPAGCGVVAFDMHATGFADSLAYCGSGKLETAWVNTNGTLAGGTESMPNPGFSARVNGIAVADMDGNNGKNLLLSWDDGNSTSPGHVTLYTNSSANQGIYSGVSYLTGNQPVAAAMGDFNGTGTYSIATANYGDAAMSVLQPMPVNSATAVIKNVSAPGWNGQSVYAEYAGDANYPKTDSNMIALVGSQTASPVVTSLSPSSAVAGSAGFTLTVKGAGFGYTGGPAVNFNGLSLPPVSISPTQLTVAIPASAIAIPGSYAVSVTEGAVTSAPALFTVKPASGAPTLASLSPNFAVVGTPAIVVTAAGTGFTKSSVVTAIGYGNLTAGFVSATQLNVTLPSGLLAKAATWPIVVKNGTASSPALPFTVGAALRYPAAWGYVDATGKVGASSGNLSCNWVDPNQSYLCTITGVKFTSAGFAVDVTSAMSASPVLATVGATEAGGMAIQLTDLGGQPAQQPFYVVVYKP